ncbi:MAG: antibiotic biosynthesis monooxygenase [Thermoleophilia bacterium]|nr:antibiotic biosynthesis monooxygenase [Thermoleophilia bacterium]
MPDVFLTARITAKPGHEAEVEAAFRALLEPTHAEDGCLRYALHRVAGSPGQLLFVEHWASREALDAHLSTDHLVNVGRVTEGLLTGPVELTFLEPVPGGDAALGSI